MLAFINFAIPFEVAVVERVGEDLFDSVFVEFVTFQTSNSSLV
jgi:hypothetical protein